MIRELLSAGSLRPTLGVALGGGAVKGAVHIGVLKALEEADLRPDFISGTSIGAMVGALYAFGKKPEEIATLAKGMDWLDITSYTFSRYGLLTNKAVKKIMVEQIGEVNIEDSPIPLAIIATDITNGERVLLKSGAVADAVQASTCIPGVFVPVQYKDRMLVDGGIVEQVPTSSLKLMGADYILGVDPGGAEELQKPSNLIDVILNAMEIAVTHQTRIHTRQADLVIDLDVKQYGKPGEANVTRLYEEGYKATQACLEKIKAELADKQPSTVEILAHKLKLWREKE